jgi:hypothetical protein
VKRDWVWVVSAPVAIAAAAVPATATQYLTVAEAKRQWFGDTPLSPVSAALTREQIKAIEKQARMRAKGWRPEVWRAPDGGALYVDRVIGKHEDITYAVALDSAGAVRGVEILDYRETYGYEVRNEHWRAQFIGKNPASAVKLGQDIKNVSGATLSCRHVTDGVRRVLAHRAVTWK